MEKVYYQPEYVSKFQCDGAACDSACCRDWQIEIDKKAYNRYVKIAPDKVILKNGKNYIKLDENATCPLLTDKNLCSIQLKYGEEYLSGTCRTYPRRTYVIEDFCERTLSLACPIAARLALNGTMIFETVEMDDDTDLYDPNVPEELSEYVIYVQAAGVKILKRQELTIDQRLIVLGYYLDKLEELIDAGNFEEIEKVSALYRSNEFFKNQIPEMLSTIKFDRAAYEKLMLEIISKVEILKESALKNPATNAKILENYLINEFFGNIYPWRFEESISKNYGVFVITYKLLEVLLTRGDPIEVIIWFSRNIDHDLEYYKWLKTRASLDIVKTMQLLKSD